MKNQIHMERTSKYYDILEDQYDAYINQWASIRVRTPMGDIVTGEVQIAVTTLYSNDTLAL